MNLTVCKNGGNVFTHCECIAGYTFKMVAPRGKSTHLTAFFAGMQDKSVHMTVLKASRHMCSS